jgi:hypothetical protein
MGSLADYAENKILDHLFGAVAFTAPGTLYFGLSTSTITDAGGNITEPSGNAYARVAITNNATNFPAAAGGSKSNGAAITFPQASGSWGTVVDFFLSDAVSGGNIIAYGTLTTPKAITNGDTAAFGIGDFNITLN